MTDNKKTFKVEITSDFFCSPCWDSRHPSEYGESYRVGNHTQHRCKSCMKDRKNGIPKHKAKARKPVINAQTKFLKEKRDRLLDMLEDKRINKEAFSYD